MNSTDRTVSGKVPELTWRFLVIKVAATTLGDTAGDAVTMSMNLGYLLLGAGYAFGNVAWVGQHLTMVLLGIVT